MSPSKLIYMTTRSAEELDDRCGMAYYWNQIYGRAGIVPRSGSLALKLGAATHEDLSTLADEPDLSPENLDRLVREITDPLSDDDRIQTETMEDLYRRLGWLVAFGLFIEPKTRSNWENVACEDEIILDREPFWCCLTPDRVLRHRESGKLMYREYKTTISSGTKWQQHWRYDIQLHAGIAALQEELGEEIAFAQVMGLMKGFKSTGGRLSHPYVWAWKSTAGEWTHEYEKARGANWTPAPVWDYPGGVVEWVQKCGEGIAIGQFPLSAPVMMDSRMVEEWVKSRTARHVTIEALKEESRTNADLRAVTFPRRTSACSPAWGDACPYLLPCWNASANLAPMASGLFIPRESHHEIERLWLAEKEKG